MGVGFFNGGGAVMVGGRGGWEERSARCRVVVWEETGEGAAASRRPPVRSASILVGV